MNLDYKIVIPSYKRAEQIKNKTLFFLNKHNIPTNKIYIFVANFEERDLYINALPVKYHKRIIIGLKGILNQRNYIIDYFKEGEYILSIDDDITDISVLQPKNKKIELFSFLNLIKYSYKLLLENNAYMWGFNRDSNILFKKNKITTNFCLILAGCYGFINRKNIKNKIEDDTREDVERSILYFKRDKILICHSNLILETKYFNEGGILADITKEERLNRADLIVEQYMNLYPDFIKCKKKNGIGIQFYRHKCDIQLTDYYREYELLRFPKKSCYVASFDDYFPVDWKEITDYANQLNIPITFFMNSYPYLNDTENKHIIDKITENNKILYHTENHFDMKEQNDIDILNDIKGWKRTFAYLDVMTGAYPYGNLPTNRGIVYNDFIGMRGTNYGLSNNENNYNIKSINIGLRTTDEKLTKELNKAIQENKTMIISGHSINNNGWSPINKQVLFKHFEEVNKLRDFLFITDFETYIKYKIQHKNSYIKINKNGYKIIYNNLKFNPLKYYIYYRNNNEILTFEKKG